MNPYPHYMKGKTLSILTLLLALCTWAHGQADAKDFQQGKRAYERGEYRAAISYLDQAVKNPEVGPEAYIYRGMAHYELGAFFEAEVDFKRGLNRVSYRGQTPSTQADTELMPGDAAKIHNNRGMALYQLGEHRQAMEEFRTAFTLDDNLDVARDNYYHAQAKMRGEDFEPDPQENMYNGVYRDKRPQLNARSKRKRPKPDLEAVKTRRALRLVEQGLAEPDRELKGEIFKSRRVWFKKTYERPDYQAASQEYIDLVEVEITREATFITLQVSNPTLKGAEVCIADHTREGAFYLTDRSTRVSSNRLEMKGLVEEERDGIALCPSTEQLAAASSIQFTLEFERIPDDVGYISIIEGRRNDGDQWNFFHVDLTED